MAQVLKWQPFGLLSQLDREFDELVRRSFGESAGSPSGFVPALEVLREGDDVVVRLELPGVDVERDVQVTVHDGQLTITGERKAAESGSRDGVVVREVRYGTFRRSLALPDGVDAAQVTAGYDAGILTVRIPGANAKAQPVRVPVSTPAAAPAVEAGSAPAGRAAGE